MKSEASKRLEELAKTLPKAHEDFVRFMGIMPQKHGVEEKMLEYLETEADITTDDALYHFYKLTRN